MLHNKVPQTMSIYLTQASVDWLGTGWSWFVLAWWFCWSQLVLFTHMSGCWLGIRWSNLDSVEKLGSAPYVSHPPQASGLAWVYTSQSVREWVETCTASSSLCSELTHCPFYLIQFKESHGTKSQIKYREIWLTKGTAKSLGKRCDYWEIWRIGSVMQLDCIPLLWVEPKERARPQHVTGASSCIICLEDG